MSAVKLHLPAIGGGGDGGDSGGDGSDGGDGGDRGDVKHGSPM